MNYKQLKEIKIGTRVKVIDSFNDPNTATGGMEGTVKYIIGMNVPIGVAVEFDEYFPAGHDCFEADAPRCKAGRGRFFFFKSEDDNVEYDESVEILETINKEIQLELFEL